MAAFIEVTGPNQAGQFIGTLPDGETSLLLCGEDLEALESYGNVDLAQGDLLNLSRRTPAGSSPSTETPSGVFRLCSVDTESPME